MEAMTPNLEFFASLDQKFIVAKFEEGNSKLTTEISDL